jgi:uncharacterized membrane protein HdeD (DUF308 family)
VTPGLYRRAVAVFGVLAVVLGLAILAETARAGGGSVGYLFGVLFVALGCGRLFLLYRR